MKLRILLFITVLFIFSNLAAQEPDNLIKHFQIKAGRSDSLIIKIQEEAKIALPDPNGAIEVNLSFSNPDEQYVVVAGGNTYLKDFTDKSLAETLRKLKDIEKMNLDISTTFTSVFTRIWDKVSFQDWYSEPINDENTQLPKLNFINRYFTLFGGERLGIPLEKDSPNGIGISFGVGTPYSGPLESNQFEANFNILGGSIGLFNSLGDITDFSPTNNHNNIYSTLGFQANYIFPLMNVFEIQYQHVIDEISNAAIGKIIEKAALTNSDGSKYLPKFIKGNYVNFELRYPIQIFDSQRGRIYLARYQNEMYAGFNFYEVIFARNTFDFRMNYMFNSDVRRNQINIDLLLSKVFSQFGGRNFAFGPTVSFSKLKDNKFGFLKAFMNIRVRLSD